MNLPARFISCDWGTTNFRLRLVDTATLDVIAEDCTNRGVKQLWEDFRASDQKEAVTFFGNYLTDRLLHFPLIGTAAPVVISGMASANIGMHELPYARMPFFGDGRDLVARKLWLKDGRPAIIVSGARGASGMMRGEETQAIGLAEKLAPHGNGYLLLPGTHSKHLTYRDGAFTELTTYMTGEIFSVLSKNSLLAHSLREQALGEPEKQAFLEGVRQAIQGRIAPHLFSVRARDLLLGIPPAENYYFLSGLLIGDELSAVTKFGGVFFLAASGRMRTLYDLALTTIVTRKRCVTFGDGVLDESLLNGQRKMLAHHVL